MTIEPLEKLDGECIIWAGSVSGTSGHPKARRGTKTVSVRRETYEKAIGPIPPGQWVLMRCTVMRCLNPQHMMTGRHKEMTALGQGFHANHTQSPECANGHPRTPENQIGKDKDCRQCNMARSKAYRARKKKQKC